MPDDRQRQQWERQPDEPVKHYRRFQQYLKLGPERSVRKAAQVAKLSPKGRRPAWLYWKQIATRWQWADRAKAFDAWQADIRQKEQDRLAVEAAIEEAEENERQRKLRLTEARAARSAGRSIIQKFLARVAAGELDQFAMIRTKNVVVTKGTDEEGKLDGTFVRQEIERKGLPEVLGLALQAVIEGAKAERLELGEVTERTEHQVSEKEQKVREVAEVFARELLNGSHDDDSPPD